MLHISTQDGYGTPEAWTPREISRGLGDGSLIRTNQGNQSGGPFRLSNYPQSRAAIRRALRHRRYLGLP